MAAPRRRAQPSADELLGDLSGAEDKLIAAVDLAAGVAEQLAGPAPDGAELQRSSEQFIGLLRDVHRTLADRAHVSCSFVQMERSAYGASLEADLAAGDAAAALALVRGAQEAAAGYSLQ